MFELLQGQERGGFAGATEVGSEQPGSRSQQLAKHKGEGLWGLCPSVCLSVCLSAGCRLQALSNLLLSLFRVQPDSPELWKYDRQKQSGSAAVSLSRVQSTEPGAWAVRRRLL